MSQQPSFAPVKPSKATFVRRRIMVLASFLLAIAATVSFFTPQAEADSSRTSVSTAFTYVNVRAGQDLWALAEQYAGEVDHRDWVAKLINLNALESNTLQPGQRLALPR